MAEHYRTKVSIYLTVKNRIRIEAGGQLDRLRYLVGGARWTYNPHTQTFEGGFNMRNIQRIFEKVQENWRYYELSVDPRILAYYKNWNNWRLNILKLKRQKNIDLSDQYFRAHDLRPYQRVDVATLVYGLSIDGLEMGLGKTVECCATVDIWTQKDPTLLKGLIVAPTNALHIWKQHILGVPDNPDKRPWTHFDKADIIVADESSSQDKALMIFLGQRPEVGRCVTIIPWSTLQNDSCLELLSNFEYDWAIIDEAHRGRNPRAKQSRAFQQLKVKKNPNNPFFSYKLETSGTSIVNYGEDLFPLVHWVQPTQYDDLEAFKEDFVYKPTEEIERWRRKKDVKKEKIDALHQELDYILIQRRLQDVMKEIPKANTEWVYLPLNKKQRTLYEQMRDEFLIFLDNEDEQEQVDAMTAIARLMRLKQLAISPATIELLKHKPKDITEYELRNDDSSKLDWVLDFIDDTEPTDKIVIFSQFTSALNILENRILRSDLYRKTHYAYCVLTGTSKRICFQEFDSAEDLERQFQENPDVKVWLGSLKASGEALTLTASHICICLDQWWNGATMDQAVGRLIRFGQKYPVQIYNLVAENTVEQGIIEKVLSRRDLFNKMIRTRAYLRELLEQDKERK